MSDKPKEIWAHPHEHEGWSRLGTWNVEFAWDEDEELYVRADRIEALTAERDALKAENDRLREALDDAINEAMGVVPESADAFYDYNAGRIRPTGEHQ